MFYWELNTSIRYTNSMNPHAIGYLYIIWITGWSCLACILYGVDKLRAQERGRRIRERTLLMLAIIGGVFGAILGVIIFRHKKNSSLFWAILGGSLIVHGWILNKMVPLQDMLTSILLQRQF